MGQHLYFPSVPSCHVWDNFTLSSFLKMTWGRPKFWNLARVPWKFDT